MNLIIFFTTENKSGYKTKESFLKKNHNDLYQEIINYTIDLKSMPFKHKIWHYIHKIKEVPTCKKCGVNLKFKRSLTEGYGVYCSLNCTNSDIEHINKIKITNTIKYGGNAPNCSKEIRDKISATTMLNYGVPNIFYDTEFIKQKIIAKYGVDHASKLDEVKAKKVKTNIERYGVSTPILLKRSRDVNNKRLLNIFEKKYSHLNIVNGIGKFIEIICNDCNHQYSIDRSLLYYRHENKVNPCTICNPIGEFSSIKENDLCKFLTEKNIEYIKNDRFVLNGKELDLYIPSHNLAIEFNGVYWHSNLHKPTNYHLDKTNICNSNGIQLIHIFEDEWDDKKEIVKSIILNKLNKVEHKIYARNCTIKLVPTNEKSTFLDENHIQGKVGSTINIGLYQNETLVSIMTFGPKRLALGSKTSNENEFELIRFCNKLNTSVVGGASKLLKFFIKEYNPVEILSYADRRWSNGNLYKILGFKEIKTTTPNYYYVFNKKRRNRFQYRKDVLIKKGFDKNKTESQIMEELGIPRIYDVGNFVFKLNF